MLKKLNNKKKAVTKLQKGFTIIEVMIVLAIAGLILVVVLIAIPQLQRNQRNSARQNDTARVGTSVSNWVANNNGNKFVAGTGNANLLSVGQDLGGLSQYEIKAANGSITAASVVGVITVATGTQTALGGGQTPDPADLNRLRIVTGAKCGTSGASTATGASARQFVIQFATENSSGVPQGQCLEV